MLVQRLAIIGCCTAAGAGWLAVRGPLPIIRFTTVMAEPVPLWYSLSAFPVLGMLLADWSSLLKCAGLRLRTIELGVQIALILLLANLRLGVQVPLSGHVILFSYFLARRLLVGVLDDPIRHLEWAAAAAVLIIAGYVKLMWWSDPLTLLFGAVGGTGLAGVSWWLVNAHIEAMYG